MDFGPKNGRASGHTALDRRQNPKRHHTNRHHTKRQNAKRHTAERHHPNRHNAKRQNANRHNAKRHHANRHNAKRHNASRHHAKRHNASRHNAKRHHARRHNGKRHHANKHIYFFSFTIKVQRLYYQCFILSRQCKIIRPSACAFTCQRLLHLIWTRILTLCRLNGIWHWLIRLLVAKKANRLVQEWRHRGLRTFCDPQKLGSSVTADL